MKLTKEQAQEIKDQQSQENTTKRVNSTELEKVLYPTLLLERMGILRKKEKCYIMEII